MTRMTLEVADGAFVGKVDRLHELAETDRLDPAELIASLRQRGRVAEFAPSTEELLDKLLPRLQPTDVVAVFSNGKFDGIHDKLLARLRERGGG